VAGDGAAARDPSRDQRRRDAVQAAVWLQREWTAAPNPRDRLRSDRRVARGVHRALLGHRGDALGIRWNAPTKAAARQAPPSARRVNG
jgi:hypothetical protein